ncbi:hypothetical protein N7474_000350 [Penicillium riverlandense]|uniref:uncharacterized protein n=1 Tax=Penicillium riverlandense TaxID=1903569 RepID=UPI002546D6D7|nr:uncharacterized protein N7474_000350 [Penicillium riverlandense]KAJ5832039.1 hypothetical protein N7474_000350 [Penicillium riverlandense]
MKAFYFLAPFLVLATAEVSFQGEKSLPEEAFETHIFSERAGSPSVSFDEYVAKGRRRWAEFQSVLADPNAIDVATIDVTKNWVVGQPGPITVSDDTEYALKQAGVNVARNAFAKVMVRLRTNNQIFYENYVAPQVGTLIAANNYGRATNPQTGLMDTAPDKWSAVMWVVWQAACGHLKIDPSTLSYVFQDEIINTETNSTLATAAADRMGEDAAGNPLITTWTPDDDAFYAALATPNGIGTLFFLKDYSIALDRQTIKSISVFYEPEPQWFTMWFELEDSCY